MEKLVIKCNGIPLMTIKTEVEFHVPEKEFWASIINQPVTFEGDYPTDVAHILAALRLKDASGQISVLQQLHPIREKPG